MCLLVIVLPPFVVILIILSVIIRAGVTQAEARQPRMSEILSGSLERIKIKRHVEDRRDRGGRIISHDAPSCQQKRIQASFDPAEVAGQIIRGERGRGRG